MKLLHYIEKSSVLKIFNGKVLTFAALMFVTCWNFNRPC